MYKIILPVIFLIFLTGCAQTTHLSDEYGKSYNALFSAQVINPDAPLDRAPVDGMPGYTAAQIYNDVYLPGLTESGSNYGRDTVSTRAR
jgi:PBP1b-binding outer membrane lipoprotein LpoB